MEEGRDTKKRENNFGKNVRPRGGQKSHRSFRFRISWSLSRDDRIPAVSDVRRINFFFFFSGDSSFSPEREIEHRH